ncbi:Ribosomal large subunit pseudouridine synthase B [bioreactor metagenome]|uniref:Ribosomal large subunit pseudouridine synthase B n=1 Tax=bioreactor metagenome TaxID=1076179 RepID=A0A644VIN2_9ZZZZ|nr:pseudouridine synthase [Negativicutes bacterium]
MGEKERQRLDKVLAHIGYGTRKEIKQIVKAGRVNVNGQVVKQADVHVWPYKDSIEVDGKQIIYREYIYLMMNKPPGCISATEDAVDKVVIDLLAPEHKTFEPFPVGRLDKDTEGLLLLTNDGKLAHMLLSPKKHVPKTYFAQIAGEVTEKDCEVFRNGIILDDGYRTLPSELIVLSSGLCSEIEVTIYEGKFHQIKRMFAAVGKRVVYLKRVKMGPLKLDIQLDLGQYRELSNEEIAALFNANKPK